MAFDVAVGEGVHGECRSHVLIGCLSLSAITNGNIFGGCPTAGKDGLAACTSWSRYKITKIHFFDAINRDNGERTRLGVLLISIETQR